MSRNSAGSATAAGSASTAATASPAAKPAPGPGVGFDYIHAAIGCWSIDSSQTAALAANALGTAIANRAPLPSGTVIHSDHGVQHVLGLHPASEGIRARPVDGLDR